MKKFKVRYYELVMKNGHQYEETKEDVIEALTFDPLNDGVVFYNENMSLRYKKAYYPNVISVNEVE